MWHQSDNYVITGSPTSKELDLYHLVVAPSFACNLRCEHCYLPDHKKTSIPSEVTSSLISDWSDIVTKDRGALGGVFHLKGGEPTYLAGFEDILSQVEISNLRFLMTTNGIRLTDRSLKLLKKMARCENRVIITVSLDGASARSHDRLRGIGTFEKSWSNLKRLIAAEVPVHVNFVAHRNNIREVEPLVAKCRQTGVTQLNILPFVRRGYGASLSDFWLSPEERFEELNDIYERLDQEERQLLAGSLPDLTRGPGCLSECVVGYRGLYYVIPNGKVYSCPNLVDEEFSLGNVLEQSLTSIHYSNRLERVYNAIPSFSDGGPDLSCKGAVLGELRKGRSGQAESARRLSRNMKNEKLLQIGDGSSTDETSKAMSACFSRNI